MGSAAGATEAWWTCWTLSTTSTASRSRWGRSSSYITNKQILNYMSGCCNENIHEEVFVKIVRQNCWRREIWIQGLLIPPYKKHTHTSDVSIFFARREGFHAQYRGKVLFWPKSDESKKAWPSSTCLLYALAALKMMKGNRLTTPIHIKNIISYQSKNPLGMRIFHSVRSIELRQQLRKHCCELEFSFIFINWWIVWSGSPRSPSQWFIRLTRGGRFR